MWPDVVGDFDCYPLSQSDYRLTYGPITQTGSSIQTVLNIPPHHFLNTIFIEHTDSSDAENKAAMAIRVDRKVLGRWRNMYEAKAATWAHCNIAVDRLMDGSAQYKFTTDTTNTHRVYLSFYVSKAKAAPGGEAGVGETIGPTYVFMRGIAAQGGRARVPGVASRRDLPTGTYRERRAPWTKAPPPPPKVGPRRGR